VGVYRGGSAQLIAELKGKRNLYLFDNFEEGLLWVGEIDNKAYYMGEFKTIELHKGDYAFSYQKVKDRLSKYQNVYMSKGIFPKTSEPVENKKFSFVNLDVDTHKSTLDCLKFFYPRMVKGGIIISHDYIGVRGVRNAFDEFFKNRSEPIIEMSGSQCLIVKI
jgi:hypothetical protein